MKTAETLTGAELKKALQTVGVQFPLAKPTRKVTCVDCGETANTSYAICPRSLYGGEVLCDECEEARRDAEIFAAENAEVARWDRRAFGYYGG